MRTDVVFFSGGVDSTTLLWDLHLSPHRYGIHPPRSLRAVHFDWGHRDLGVVKRSIHSSLIPDEVFLQTFQNLLHARGRDNQWEHPHPDVGESPEIFWKRFYQGKSAYVPFLQPALTFLWLNCFIGVNQDIEELHLWFAFQDEPEVWKIYDETETPWWGETTMEWLSSFEDMLEVISTPYPIETHAPWLEHRLSRSDVVKIALEIGVPLKFTSSCTALDFPDRCGKCSRCKQWDREVRPWVIQQSS